MDNEFIEQIMQAEEIEFYLNILPERECLVLTHRFGLRGHIDKTLAQVAEIMKVTKERIRQMESKALRRIRNMLMQIEKKEGR